jgi:hypothetical protein
MATHLIVACGDLHAGSTVAPCPPEGIELDDGGVQMPNKLQRWLYDNWLDAWNQYGRLRDEYKPETQTLVLNGDLVDGVHHKSPQLAPLVGQHFRAALTLLERGPLRFGMDAVHMVRGTESHSGRAGEIEEGIARTLRAEGVTTAEDPDTGQVSSYWRRFEVEGVRFDCRHHGRFGQRTHTKDAYLRHYAHDIWEAHVRSGERPPDICLRSHRHQYGDSGRIHDLPTRVLALPAWQALTSYCHRITIEDLGKHGIVVVPVRDGQYLEPHAILYEPARPTVVR